MTVWDSVLIQEYKMLENIDSSIVNEAIRTIFFIRKILQHKIPQNKQFSPLMKFLCAKNCCFWIASFTILMVYTPFNPSMENYFSNNPAPSFFYHIFICVHPFYLSEPLLICQNLFLFVRTYFYLWESLLVYDHLWESFLVYDHLWKSIFLSLYENKYVYEYHHQNMIMIFYWSDRNGTRTHNHLVRKWTLNHLAKLAKWLSCVVSTYLYGAFDSMFSSCHLRISELIHFRLRISDYALRISDFAPASSNELLDIQGTIECGFTLKCISDMIRTYSHILLISYVLILCFLF